MTYLGRLDIARGDHFVGGRASRAPSLCRNPRPCALGSSSLRFVSDKVLSFVRLPKTLHCSAVGRKYKWTLFEIISRYQQVLRLDRDGLCTGYIASIGVYTYALLAQLNISP